MKQKNFTPQVALAAAAILATSGCKCVVERPLGDDGKNIIGQNIEIRTGETHKHGCDPYYGPEEISERTIADLQETTGIRVANAISVIVVDRGEDDGNISLRAPKGLAEKLVTEVADDGTLEIGLEDGCYELPHGLVINVELELPTGIDTVEATNSSEIRYELPIDTTNLDINIGNSAMVNFTYDLELEGNMTVVAQNAAIVDFEGRIEANQIEFNAGNAAIIHAKRINTKEFVGTASNRGNITARGETTDSANLSAKNAGYIDAKGLKIGENGELILNKENAGEIIR